MKFNKWTMGLAAVGVVSLASAARADEKMSQLQTALSNTTISGYVDTAATWRPGTDQGAYYDSYYYGEHPNVPHYAFAKDDGFSLNAVDIAIDHPEDESPWAAGYHVELMYGPDSVGVPLSFQEEGFVYNSTYYGVANFAVRQAYLTLRTPVGNSGIDWKIGVFDTPIGYESSSDPNNPNYTRSYGYTIEPTTHTGILATYAVNSIVTLQAGVADSAFMNSFVPTTTYESQKTYMGTVALTAPDSMGFMKGATLNMGVIEQTDSQAYGAGSTTSWYLGATVPTPLTALKVGAAFDYYEDHDRFHFSATDQNPSDDNVWIIGLYGNYQINDKASMNLRGEYVNSGGEGPYYNVNSEEVTATLQYNLWANVMSRVEFRWDHSEAGKPFGYGGGVGEGSGEPDKANDFLLALNLIYQF
jgi:hypothetical protein